MVDLEHVGYLRAPRVYSYCRWSTREQANGDSSRRQHEAAEQWAAKQGYVLDQSLCIFDEGLSAFRGDNAFDGGLSRFLKACREGLVQRGSYLVVESLDRISRMAPRKAQRLIDDIVDSGVTIVTLCDDQHYTAERLDSDPTALLLALLISWRAHEESKTKACRVAAAWAEKRRRVRANPKERLTRRAPSWLHARPNGQWEEDQRKSDIVRRIYSMTLGGMGEHRIAATLNQEGIPALAGGIRWHRSTISKLLRNAAVIGKLTPGRMKYVNGRRLRITEEPIDGAFPTIVSAADWSAVRALKDGKSGMPRGCQAGNGVTHYFGGLARCPQCGCRMLRVNKGAAQKCGRPKLVCSAAKSKAGCRYFSVSISAVERAFVSNLTAVLEHAPSGREKRLRMADNEAITAKIVRFEDHFRRLCIAFEHSPSEGTSVAVARAEVELKSLRARRREALETCVVSGLDGRLHELKCMMADEVRRSDRTLVNTALKILFESVVIDYRNNMLRFQWRGGGETLIAYVAPEGT
jgi:DNA invertase Pin-like site-specific DNA recombinase